MAPRMLCFLCRSRHKKHSIRGAISGALKKKLGLEVTSEKDNQNRRIYRLI